MVRLAPPPAVVKPSSEHLEDSVSDNKDHELSLQDLRDALALIVRSFHVIAKNLGDFHAESEVMIKSIDLIAVIQRIEGRMPASIDDGLPAEDFPKAFNRDLRDALALIVKTLIVISENIDNPSARSEVMSKAIDLTALVSRIEDRM